MFCENCGQKLEEGARFCENCGTPVVPAENGGQTIPPGGGNPTTPNGGYAGSGWQKKPEKKGIGGLLKILIPVAVVIVVLAVGAAAFAMGGEFFKRTFSSPEKYFQHVAKKSLQKNAEIVANHYNTLIKEQANFTDRSAKGTVVVRLGDSARDLIELAGSLDDVSWLEEASLESEVSVKDRVFSGSAALLLGKDKILTENIAADEKAFYMQIPELSDKYIGVDLETFLEKYYPYTDLTAAELFDYLDELYASLPEKKQVASLFYKYFSLAVSCIEEVEKGKEALDAGGVTEKCMTLETVIRTSTAKNITKTVLKAMREDEELKEIIKNFSKMEGLDGAYDEFRDGLDMALDAADDLELPDNIVLTLYVNGKGDVVGLRAKMGDAKYYCAGTQKGKDVGYEMTLEADGQVVRLEGQGKESGGKVTADCTFKVDAYGEQKSAEFRFEDLDRGAWEKGNIKGAIVIPLKEVDDLLDLNNRILRRYDMALGLDIGDGNISADLRIMEEKEEFAAVSYSLKQGAGKKGSVPSGKNVVMAEDEQDILEWAESINADAFLKGLRKSKIPADIVDEIEDEIDNALEQLSWMGSASW